MKQIVGIDEVGRGPLAGPVTVCVVSCEEKMYAKLKRDSRLPKAGKDSKKLSQKEREVYAEMLKKLAREKKISFSIQHVSNKLIDRRGISFCIKKAISQGLRKLKLNPKQCAVLLDGSLHAPKEFTKQKTIIRGDEKEKIIAWASILAKVSRDRRLQKLGKKFPQYGFEIHKGYGTAKHRAAIHQNGLTIFHRHTFCRSLVASSVSDTM